MIDYNSLPSRSGMITRAINDCLKFMYKVSYPSSDGIGNYKKHYLPEHIYKMIRESFLDAYRISPEVNDTFDTFKKFVKEPYRIATHEEKKSGSCYIEESPMKDDDMKRMTEYIDMFLNTHRWNGEEQMFSFNIANYAPSSNREEVEKEVRKTDPSFKIPDDSYWDEQVDENDEWFENEYEDDNIAKTKEIKIF